MPQIPQTFRSSHQDYYLDIEDPVIQAVASGNFSSNDMDTHQILQERFQSHQEDEQIQRHSLDFHELLQKQAFVKSLHSDEVMDEDPQHEFNRMLAEPDSATRKQKTVSGKLVPNSIQMRDMLSQQTELVTSKFEKHLLD